MDEIMKAVMVTLVDKITEQLAVRMEQRFEVHRSEMAKAYAGRIAELERRVQSVYIDGVGSGFDDRLSALEGRVEAMNVPGTNSEQMTHQLREQILDYLEPLIKAEVTNKLHEVLHDSDVVEDAVDNYLNYKPEGQLLLKDVMEDVADERMKNRMEDMISETLDDFVDSLRIVKD